MLTFYINDEYTNNTLQNMHLRLNQKDDGQIISDKVCATILNEILIHCECRMHVRKFKNFNSYHACEETMMVYY